MRIALKQVTFLESIQGPGPRNQAENTATYATMKVKSGENVLSPTGLTLTWDTEQEAVYVEMAKTTVDPCVVVGWHLVKRVLPEPVVAKAKAEPKQEVKPAPQQAL